MKSSLFTLIAIILVAGSCIYERSNTPIEGESIATGAASPAVESKKPVLIGTLRSRQNTIHLYVGKFTVEDANGKVLARLVNDKQFSTLLPRLFSKFKQMYAEGQLIADNRTRRNLSDGWIYSSPTRFEAVSKP